MEATRPIPPPISAVQQSIQVVRPETTEDGKVESDTKPVDTELFIRKSFETEPKKGCELLFRLYYRPMCTHASRFVYSKEIAEDLVADVFYTFWNTHAYRSIQQSYRAYLFRAVRNRAYNYLAYEFKKLDPLETVQPESLSVDSPETLIQYEELYHKVDQLVATLPPQCRKVFIMYRFESRKAKDIAAELTLSVRTVEVHIAKALAILRSGLKDQWLLVALLIWLKNAL